MKTTTELDEAIHYAQSLVGQEYLSNNEKRLVVLAENNQRLMAEVKRLRAEVRRAGKWSTT